MNTPLNQEHITFLDDLRQSGATNMWGAGRYLQQQFPELNKPQAKEILFAWMKHKKPAGIHTSNKKNNS